MKEVKTTVYKCDHCRKYGLSKSNIKKHEQFCFKNPENVPICFQGCEFLSSGSSDEGGKYFRCDKKKCGLISKKQIILGRKVGDFGAIAMPMEHCSDFRNENKICDTQLDPLY